ELGARPLGPDLELLLGRSPERVTGAEEHRSPVLAQRVRELADSRRLPCPVDTDDEDDPRRRTLHCKRRRLSEQPLELLRERVLQRADLAASLESPYELGGRRNTDVRAQER